MADKAVPKNIEIGERFGRLTVIGPADDYISPQGYRLYQVTCLCDCGNTTVVTGSNLKSKRMNTKSCGCLREETRHLFHHIHGQKHTATYGVWCHMKRRCYAPDEPNYKDYGGRGIYICDRWLKSFENFFADMGHKPPGMSIGRRDNDGPYSPDNCRWETAYEQQANTRKNVWVEFQGERMILAEAIRRSGLPESTVHSRLKNFWTITEALTIPVRKSRKS